MSLLPQRMRRARGDGRHTIAAVRAARTAAELAEPAGRHATPPAPADGAASTAQAGLEAPASQPALDAEQTLMMPVAALNGSAARQLPSAWSTGPDTLSRTAAALRALPGKAPASRPPVAASVGEDGPWPATAWLRAVQPDGLPHLDVELTGPARFTRVIAPARSRPRFAEVELGSAEDGPFRVAASRAWLKATAMVFLQAADALADGEAPQGPAGSPEAAPARTPA